MAQWIWTQECRLTGESNDVLLSDSEKREIESRPTFTGWGRDELRAVEDE